MTSNGNVLGDRGRGIANPGFPGNQGHLVATVTEIPRRRYGIHHINGNINDNRPENLALFRVPEVRP